MITPATLSAAAPQFAELNIALPTFTTAAYRGPEAADRGYAALEHAADDRPPTTPGVAV